MPRIGWLAPGGNWTPSSASRAAASGISPSPQAFSMGGWRRSRTTTESPASRAPIAVASPAGPPPTIATSKASILSAIRSSAPLESGAGVGQLGARHGAGQAEGGHLLGRFELPLQVEAQGFTPPQLARRGAGEGPRREDHHVIDREAGGAEDGGAAGLGESRDLLLRRAPPPLDEEGHLLARRLLGQPARRHDTAGAYSRHPLDRALDLLRRMVAAVEEDDVLGPAGEIQLAVQEETQVAGVEPAVAERLGGRLGVIQIAFHERRPGGPDPPHPALGEILAVDPHDAELEAGDRSPHRDDLPAG